MIDKNYFLDMMKDGKDIDAIAKDITNALNEAKSEMEKIQESSKLLEKKLGIANEIAMLFQEYAELAYPDALSAIGDFDGATLVSVLDESFELVNNLNYLKDIFATPAKKIGKAIPAKKSDDEVLKEFLKIFN